MSYQDSMLLCACTVIGTDYCWPSSKLCDVLSGHTACLPALVTVCVARPCICFADTVAAMPAVQSPVWPSAIGPALPSSQTFHIKACLTVVDTASKVVKLHMSVFDTTSRYNILIRSQLKVHLTGAAVYCSRLLKQCTRVDYPSKCKVDLYTADGVDGQCAVACHPLVSLGTSDAGGL